VFDAILLHVSPTTGFVAYLVRIVTFANERTVAHVWPDLLAALPDWHIRLVLICAPADDDGEWSQAAGFVETVPDVVKQYAGSWAVKLGINGGAGLVPT